MVRDAWWEDDVRAGCCAHAASQATSSNGIQMMRRMAATGMGDEQSSSSRVGVTATVSRLAQCAPPHPALRARPTAASPLWGEGDKRASAWRVRGTTLFLQQRRQLVELRAIVVEHLRRDGGVFVGAAPV